MTETSMAAIVVSIGALAVSLFTMWATLFRRGRLYMTQPTTIFFGPDGPTFDGSRKIYLRSLMYSTGKRGVVIENMFVELSRSETNNSFPIWVLGEDKLARGSGLYVGEQGAVANHHFLQGRDADRWSLKAGDYNLRVYAQIIGEKTTKLLFETSLSIDLDQSKELEQPNTGIYFDWGPKSRSYFSHTDKRDPKAVLSDVRPFLEAMMADSKPEKKDAISLEEKLKTS
jgi:hypothetical protein